MALLYLVRHGQTDWNAIKRLQGRTDIPINDVGKAQARRHGDVLAGLGVDFSKFYFVVSPLGRCIETMQIILDVLGLAPDRFKTDEALLELNYGDLEGKSWEQLRVERPAWTTDRFARPWQSIIPNGEMHIDMQRRVVDWYLTLPEKTLAVTHSGPSRMVRGFVASHTIDEIPVLESPQDRFLEITPTSYKWL